MNWNFILWFAGICATIYALKFVIILFRSLFSKDTMSAAIGAIGDKISDANEVVTKKIKKKLKEKKKKIKEEKHIGEAYVKIQ